MRINSENQCFSPPPAAKGLRFYEEHSDEVIQSYNSGSLRVARESGFSLVELSIVLVILGLLTGGILTGQNLIRAAELRAVLTERETIVTAAMAFKDKYMALPGDIKNATKFWGAMTNCGVASPSGTGTQTCDGNGDGIIITPTGAGRTGETFTFWQHLANAGMIKGSYTGIAGSAASIHHATQANSFVSKMNGGAWWAHNWNTTVSGSTASYDGVFKENYLQFGGFSASGTPFTSLLKPEESWNLDVKIDDGRPAFGKMRERFWDVCTDAANSADFDSDYLLGESANVCTPFFYAPF